MSRLTHAIDAAAVSDLRRPEPGRSERIYRFPVEFPGFAGHFPGYPLLPAVAQVQTAFRLVEQSLGRPLRLAGVENAKFLLQLRPEEEVTVQVKESARDGKIACEARLLRGGELAAVFTLVMQEAG